MRFDSNTAAVMRKAARGPADIALRQARIGPNGALIPTSGASLRRGGSVGTMRRHTLGALGDAVAPNTTQQIEGKAASTAASYGATVGAASIAEFAGAGAAAGPIGLVVGAIIGVVVTKIFDKQYLDVASANAQADAAYNLFNQYRQIAGQVSGRQLGLTAMNAIWKGALYAGNFRLNNQQLCFHRGCLKYRGQPEWIEATINGPDNAFTLATSYNQFVNAARASQSAALPVAATGSMMSVASQPIGTRDQLFLMSRGALRGYRRGPGYLTAPRNRPFVGLGALGAISGVPEAVVLVDQYLIPANTRDNPAWLVPQTPLEHQILYDVADAWLAAKHPELPTTPYIATAPPINPTVVQPPVGGQVLPPVSVGLPVPQPIPVAVVGPSVQMLPSPGAGGGFAPQPVVSVTPPTTVNASAAPAGGMPILPIMAALAYFTLGR